MEEIAGEGLTWEPFDKDENDRDVCRIYWELPDVDFGRTKDWLHMMEFMIDKMLKLEKAFVEYRDFVKYFKSE